MTSNPNPDQFGPPQAPPQSVVSLVPSITETLFNLALGDRIIGITDYCVHPADRLAELPRLGGTKNPQISDIVALRPDLVIMNRDENRLQDAELLANAGVNVWATHPRSIQDSINLLWQIMEVFEEPSMVERVRWIERQKDWIIAATQQPRPSVFVPIWLNPWMTVSSGTYTNDLLYVCGGVNVFEQVTPSGTSYPELSLEQIVTSQPEVILLPNEPFEFGPQHADMLANLDIPAAHNGRIHLIDGTLLTWFGTRTTQALNELPPLLLPTPSNENRE